MSTTGGVSLMTDSHGGGPRASGPGLPAASLYCLDMLTAGVDVGGSKVFAALVVENDANAAAWAEQQYGAARGSDDTIMLTVGTGIGGGAVLGGRLFRGHNGFACEFGHITLVDGGPLCACGQRGCLEALASGTAIGRMAREGIATAGDSILLEPAGGWPDRITGALASEAAHAGVEV